MIGIGIGIPLTRGGVSAPTLGTTMATTHYNRVIADGGVLPAGISGLGSVLDSVISAYGVTDSTDFNTKVPVFLDPQYTGYKLGAGSGTTLGQAARTVYAISSSADVTQTTAASQPLLLDWSGVNYWWGSGVNGNYCSTPDAAANQITGDIEIKGTINGIISDSNYNNLVAKSNVGNNGYYAFVRLSQLNLSIGTGIAISTATSSTLPFTDNQSFSFKITRVALTGAVSFYTSTDFIN